MNRGQQLPARQICGAMILATVLLTAGCSDSPFQSAEKASCVDLASRFTRALTSRDYEQALSMVSNTRRSTITLQGLQQDFERMIPGDWGETEPLEAHLLPVWKADYQPEDIAIVYVSIYGDVYSEAVIVSCVLDAGAPAIGDFEFGRP